MKEIWIEKLIELLNEYEIEREEKIDLFNDKEKPLWEWYKDCTGDLTFEPIDSKILNWEAFSWDTANSVIISKSYGFIWWLVENDKIDLYKLPIRLEEYYQSTEAVGYITDDETILLMQLAIQDEPIEFLISILK